MLPHARIPAPFEREFHADIGCEHGSADTACGRDRASAKGVASSGIVAGICYLYVPHTTAAITITINECADPDVALDVEGALDRLIPATVPYRHSEGNSDSHVKAVLVGASQIIHVEGGKLVLGRWQGVFFCEFDGPRDRRLQLKVVAN